MLDEATQKRLLAAGRNFMKGDQNDDPYAEDFVSDQDAHLPQPPLVKAAVTPESAHIPLPRAFSGLVQNAELTALLRDRHSSRVYTEQSLSLAQLSFLLWATQGVKRLRGKAYATLRTVPSGGARHAFETYLVVRKVEGLAPGAYHYLPMTHALEFLKPLPDLRQCVTDSLCGQSWAAKASVVFYWSAVAYRAEWRYGIYAHRVALLDAGHVGENLYLACAGLGLGCCAIAAFSHEKTAALFDLDGQEEFVVYTMPVGTVRETDRAAEQAFYRFVEEEGL